MIFVASYPTDTAGILRAGAEMGLTARLFGGALVGLSTAVMRQQLGPLMNGVVLLEQWVPAPSLQFPGVMDFLKIYRARAPGEGVDPERRRIGNRTQRCRHVPGSLEPPTVALGRGGCAARAQHR